MNDLASAGLSQGLLPADYLTLLAVCALRFYIVLSIFPPTAEALIHGVVRNAMVLLFSAYIAYGQPVAFVQSLHGVALVALVMREVLIGLAIGFAASSVFWVAEGAGTYIDDLTGYNSLQITNPMRQEQSTPTALLLSQVAVVAFWSGGGMTILLGVLYESFHWWPITSSGPNLSSMLESFVLSHTDSLVRSVAKLAGPMMFILLLIDLAVSFAAKSASKLDISVLGQPVKGAVTVLMLALFVGMFVDEVRSELTLHDLAAELRLLASAAKPEVVQGTPGAPGH